MSDPDIPPVAGDGEPSRSRSLGRRGRRLAFIATGAAVIALAGGGAAMAQTTDDSEDSDTQQEESTREDCPDRPDGKAPPDDRGRPAPLSPDSSPDTPPDSESTE